MLVISLVSVSGIVSQLSLGQTINWWVTSLFIVGGMTGLWAGTRVSQRLSPSTLQKTFAVSILLVAVFVLLKNTALN